jgi:hypothetical protein
MPILLGACIGGQRNGSASFSERLHGTWLAVEGRSDRDLTACSSGLPISYALDGTYSLFEESGRWRLHGATLTETSTEAHEDVIDPAEVEIGKPFRSTIRWLTRDSFIKTYSDGRQEIYRRCTDNL